MLRRIAQQVATRYLIATNESLAVAISEKIRMEFQEAIEKFAIDWQWDNKTSTIKGGRHGQFSFSARPTAWDTAEVRDEGGLGKLQGGLLFVGSYDKELRSRAPGNPDRLKEWEQGGGNPAARGVIVPFSLQVGYYRKKLGHGMNPEYTIDLAGGLVEVTNEIENVDVHFENVSSDSSALTDLIQSCMDSPPEGSLEYIKVPVRQRLKK